MSITIEQLESADSETLIALLKDIDVETDVETLTYLASLVENRSQSELIREEAAVALGRSQTESSREILRDLLSACDPVVRQFAAEGLREDDAPDSIFWLISALTDSINKVRNVAERALLKRESQLAAVGVAPLLTLLEHPDTLTSSPAARLLGTTKSSLAFEPLVRMLNAEEWLARMWAAKALGDLGDQRAVEHLLKRITSDEKNRVRAAAVEAIASLRPDNIEEILGNILANDDDAGVQKTAHEALLALGFQGEEPDYDPFADD